MLLNSDYKNNPNSIDWMGDKSHVFLNPRLPKNEFQRITDIVQNINEKHHIFLLTSGSSSTSSSQKYKLVALPKNAFLNSSKSVNETFKIDANDILLNLLPIFHVGGLSLFSRAFCSNAKLLNIWDENFKWNAKEFVNICKNTKSTITSLVPTQVFDLVAAKLASPVNLRCVFVGGGAISQELLSEASALGWKLYPSYGMTECCSQVATFVSSRGSTARSSSERISESSTLSVLPHLNVSINENACITISGNSLLSYYVHISENNFTIQDPKINGQFITQDIGIVSNSNSNLKVLGRIDDIIKINGELVNLIHLNHTLQKLKNTSNINFESAIISVPHERSSSQLIGVFLSADSGHKEKIEEIKTNFNLQVMPYERIHKIVFVDSIPKTELGKLKINMLRQQIMTVDINTAPFQI